MRWPRLWFVLFSCLAWISCRNPAAAPAPGLSSAQLQNFVARGVVREVKSDGKTVLIKHEEIPGYMPAMTMPFKLRQSTNATDLRPGDQISFVLSVSGEESWISNIRKTGHEAPPLNSPALPSVREINPVPSSAAHP